MSTPTAAPTAPVTTQTKTASSQPAKSDPAPTTPGATPAEIKRMKLKLEGQDVEMPESEVIALAQRGKVSDKRFQEAAAMKKQAEDVLKFAKENPTEFFKKTGMNARQWAEEYLVGELKKEQMSPEQRKAAENEAKLKEYEDQKKSEADRKLQDDKRRLEQEHMQNYDKLFVEALTKSGLPKTPYTIKRMAELQLTNIRKKLELSADQLAKVVREDYQAEQKALFGAVDGDALLEMFGADIVKKLSKAQIAKLKAKGIRTASGNSGNRSTESGDKKLSWKEYQRRNRRLP